MADEVILTLQSLRRTHLSPTEGHRDLAAQVRPLPSHTPSGDGRGCTLLEARRSLSLVHRFLQSPSPFFRRCPTNNHLETGDSLASSELAEVGGAL